RRPGARGDPERALPQSGAGPGRDNMDPAAQEPGVPRIRIAAGHRALSFALHKGAGWCCVFVDLVLYKSVFIRSKALKAAALFKSLQTQRQYFWFPDMNFQQLRIVRETVRRNFNLTEVANALYTAQSGVSKHIKDLEDEMGVELFVRRGKRLLGLTEPGTALLPIVERMLV